MTPPPRAPVPEEPSILPPANGGDRVQHQGKGLVKAKPAPVLDPDGEMSFMEHLSDLRTHVVRALFWFGLGCIAAFFSIDRVWEFLMIPLCKAMPNDCFVYPRDLLESFFVYVKLGLLIAFFYSLPFLFFEAWGFVAPGLYKHEKKLALPFSFAVGILFTGGALFGYFVIFPPTLQFLYTFYGTDKLHFLVSMRSYFSLMSTMLLSFGAVFELPLVMMLVSAFGLVKPRWWGRYRRFMYIGIALFAAVITPTTDPISMMAMVIPMWLLYEVGILLAKLTYRERKIFPEEPGPEAA
jgi:sec-independent protein translocase protein TatC